jgi:cysteine desulfuration protein SufE
VAERVTEADLVEAFELLEGWEDRYAYIIGLGDAMEPFPEAQRRDLNKVTGCQSQVWMIAEPDPTDPERLVFRGDSDARIVKGLIAIVTGLFSGRTPREILALDLQGLLQRLGLDTYLTTGRRNGLASMIQRIKDIARARLAASQSLEGTA